MRDIAEAARAYSMASMPGEEVLEFHVRLIPGGRASQHIAETLKVGDSVQVEGPYGSAHLRPDDDSPLVLVAGSSGLAPAKSIARTALMMQPDRSEEHTSELQSLMRNSYAVFCLKKKTNRYRKHVHRYTQSLVI